MSIPTLSQLALAQLRTQTIESPLFEDTIENSEYVSAYLQWCAVQTNEWIQANETLIDLLLTDSRVKVKPNDIKPLLVAFANVLDPEKFNALCNHLFISYLRKNDEITLMIATQIFERGGQLESGHFDYACIEGSSPVLLALIKHRLTAGHEVCLKEVLSNRLMRHVYLDIPLVESDLEIAKLLVTREQIFDRNGQQPLEMAYLLGEKIRHAQIENPLFLPFIEILLPSFTEDTLCNAFSETFTLEEIESINQPLISIAHLGETSFEQELLAEAARMLEEGHIPDEIEGFTQQEALAYQILFERIATDKTSFHIYGSLEFKEKMLSMFKKMIQNSAERKFLRFIRLGYPIVCIESRDRRGEKPYVVYIQPDLPILLAFNVGLGEEAEKEKH